MCVHGSVYFDWWWKHEQTIQSLNNFQYQTANKQQNNLFVWLYDVTCPKVWFCLAHITCLYAVTVWAKNVTLHSTVLFSICLSLFWGQIFCIKVVIQVCSRLVCVFLNPKVVNPCSANYIHLCFSKLKFP